ncbi:MULTISPECIES: ATP-binding protein [Ralstonia]|uniref:Histidine kinase/HSP90-like ATPase domain-containing protein n=2 Tax=Ralstonia pickettii TaxID=329 RepID=R0CM38_RALPI|nr:ATP-binding protein [Ralstonia pickettii]ENZ77711.1 hypothetical protein OR214_01987 [Ralstonia pickettii OR214]MCM3583888.1 ATP-binding protein [Ralstonia pickettii]
MSSTSVRIAVNQGNLVKNLKFAFSNFSTFLAELIQNSRRADASMVDIRLEGKTLIVFDDGQGIQDFQKLFTIAESGWDAQTQSLENPFGMGFTSALFACETLKVESCGQRLEARTSALLEMRDLMVEPGEVVTGTRLTLSNLTFDEKRIGDALKEIARGYPIPIQFNGVELERPDCQDDQSFVATPIGAVSIRNLKGMGIGGGIVVYLQGIRVIGHGRSQPDGVVHLDSAQFKAKLPDRNCLIDSNDRAKEIEAQVRAVAHSMLSDLQSKMDPIDFATSYWDVAARCAPDILRNHPVVPASEVNVLANLVCFSEWHEPFAYSGKDVQALHRSDFEQGKVRVVRGSGRVDLEVDFYSAVKLAYVMKMNAYIVAGNLPKGHWLMNAPAVDELDVSFDVVSPGVVAGSCYETHSFDIQICEGVALKGLWGDVVVTDQEIAIGSGEDWLDNVTIYSPPSAARGEGVLQFTVFSSDDSHDEQYERECLAKYGRWIMQARNVQPQDLLNDLLSTITVDTDTARNTRFVLEVNEHGYLNVVEQLTPVPA